MPHQWDDDELLAELAMALRAAGEVPAEFAEMGEAIFGWRGIGAELAVLIYDSETRDSETRDSETRDSETHDSEMDSGRIGALTRNESAALRALTFACKDLTFELEITQDAVLGQLVPYRVTDVHVRTLSGDDVPVTTDEVGCFTIRPIPATPFYLRCDAENGTPVTTPWITV
jgi:hypothetical protein